MTPLDKDLHKLPVDVLWRLTEALIDTLQVIPDNAQLYSFYEAAANAWRDKRQAQYDTYEEQLEQADLDDLYYPVDCYDTDEPSAEY